MADTLDRQEQIRRNLVAAVAHELRTPIAVLQAGHEALLDDITEPTPTELGSLRDEVLRLARMVGDLQDLAAAASGSLDRRFDAAGITLDRQLAATPVLADPRWLHQVITNLLPNALKFTPPGGRVIISTRQAGPDAVLQVTGTGPGIPADELPHVFDRFWRGRQAAQTSGSGIGLSVAADLARAHGGQLTAASQQGHGTTMALSLPVA
jgi:two-component system sensor histidine kinase BaeS